MEKNIDVWYIAPGPSTENDPLGSINQENPVRTLVPASYFPESKKLVVKNVIIEDPTEGDNIGNWKRKDGIKRSIILSSLQQLRSLRTDPTVGAQIQTFLGILNPNTRENLLTTSMATLADTNSSPAVRRNALEVVKLLLIQELSE